MSGKVAPAYATISAQLQGNRWRLGAHIKPDVLADHLGISITPIREALQRLAAERMIEFRRGKGYYVRHFDAVDMAECYQVVASLITFSLLAYGDRLGVRDIPAPTPPPDACVPPHELAAYGERQAAWLENLSLGLVSLTDNREMRRIIHRCNARTHVIRVLECSDLLEGNRVYSLLLEGRQHFASHDVATVHEMLRAYFDHRVKRLPDLADRANAIGRAAPLP